MGRLLTAFILFGIVYVIGTIAFSELRLYMNDASLMLSGVDVEAVRKTVSEHISETKPGSIRLHIDGIELNGAYIDTDDREDLIAQVHGDGACGSGGCLTTILLRTSSDTFMPITFTYAVKSIDVLGTITNGMHDLRINGSDDGTMTWDGRTYVLSSY